MGVQDMPKTIALGMSGPKRHDYILLYFSANELTITRIMCAHLRNNIQDKS